MIDWYLKMLNFKFCINWKLHYEVTPDFIGEPNNILMLKPQL